MVENTTNKMMSGSKKSLSMSVVVRASQHLVYCAFDDKKRFDQIRAGEHADRRGIADLPQHACIPVHREALPATRQGAEALR